MAYKIYNTRQENNIIWHGNLKKIREASEEAPLFFNLKFLDAKKHDITETMGCRNQLLVVYKAGRFEVLPVGVNGQVIKDHLGIQFGRIRFWAALPTPSHRLHPIKNCPGPRSEFDIYEH